MLDYRTVTFLTVCEQMNYRKTAELLNMTQPGVSQHIHALEKAFGCKFFTYDGKHLSLTEQGRLYREHLQKVQYDENWLKEKMTAQIIPNLHIGATKSIGDYMISRQMVRLLESRKFTMDLTVDNTKVLLQLIKDGRLDFAMIEGDFDKEVFGHRKMREEAFVGICPAGHPIAEKKVPLLKVTKEHLLVREEGSGTRAILENQLALQGESIYSFSSVNIVSSFRVMKDIIAQGHAITFGYRSVAIGEPKLSTFMVKGFYPSHDLYYVYQKGTYAEQLLDKYLEIVSPDQKV